MTDPFNQEAATFLSSLGDKRQYNRLTDFLTLHSELQ